MFMNYLIYLNTLSKEEKLEQFIVMIGSLIGLLVVYGLIKFLKLKFANGKNDTLFQKFLNKF